MIEEHIMIRQKIQREYLDHLQALQILISSTTQHELDNIKQQREDIIHYEDKHGVWHECDKGQL